MIRLFRNTYTPVPEVTTFNEIVMKETDLRTLPSNERAFMGGWIGWIGSLLLQAQVSSMKFPSAPESMWADLLKKVSLTVKTTGRRVQELKLG